MGVGQLLLAAVVGGVPGLLMLAVGVGHVGNYYKMRGLDPADVRSLDESAGEVELTGTARAHAATSRSPFTDTECVLHEWKVREHRPANERSSWRRLDSGEARHPFGLDDGTGTALIETEGASHYLHETTIEVDPDEQPPPAVQSYLAATDAVATEHDATRHYVESKLPTGGDVYVLGPVREAGLSVDLPGGVDAVVGVENPEERGFTVGEDSLSDLVEQIRSDIDQFIVTNADEREAERGMLKRGLLWSAVGLVFVATPVVVVVAG